MKKLLSLLLLVLVTLVVSSCNNNSTTTSTTNQTGTTIPAAVVSQGVTDTTIKVGNCAATSGYFAAVGVPFNNGIEAYFKMINDAGGVNGRTIEFVHQDDEFTAEKAISCVESMIYDEDVFALVGHFGTASVGATLDDIKDAGIPTVYLATGIGQLYNENATGDERGIFPVQPIYTMEGRIMVARAQAETDADKIGVIYTNDDAGKDFLAGIYTQVGKTTGLSVVTEQVAADATDVSVAVTKVLAANVDAVIVASIQGEFPVIAKELAKQNNTAPIFTSYVSASLSITNSIATEVGTKFDVYADAWVDTSDADAVTTYVTGMHNFMGDDTMAANAYAMAGWIAGCFFVAGLERIDTRDLTWDLYMDALESAPIKNPFGGYIDFSDGQRLGTQAMSLLKMDSTSALGWAAYQPTQTIEEILAQ